MNETKIKLTDTQLRIIQVVVGVISGLALITALFLPAVRTSENVILNYLWLIIFVVVMFGRRWVERRYNMRLALYNLAMLDTLAFLIVVYASILFFLPQVLGGEDTLPNLETTWKLVIVIGLTLLIIVLGILLPIKRYFKRKEDGTLRPIRLPELEEIEDEEDESVEDPTTAKLSPLERQIQEMTQELNENKEDSNSEPKDK